MAVNPERAVPDGEARRPHIDRARLRQDHKYGSGHRVRRHPLAAALRHDQGRHMAFHTGLARELWGTGIRVNTPGTGLSLSDKVMSEKRATYRPPRPRHPVPLPARDPHHQDCWEAWSSSITADSDFITAHGGQWTAGNVKHLQPWSRQPKYPCSGFRREIVSLILMACFWIFLYGITQDQGRAPWRRVRNPPGREHGPRSQAQYRGDAGGILPAHCQATDWTPL